MNTRSIRLIDIPTAVTRETNCLLKAVDQQRLRESPYLELRVRQCAAGCDDWALPMDKRLALREELRRMINERLNVWHREPESNQTLDQDIKFWLAMWNAIKQDTPNEPLFQAFTVDDLIAEVMRDYDDDDNTDDEDNIERSSNHHGAHIVTAVCRHRTHTPPTRQRQSMESLPTRRE
jgi:hypothetical protein